MKILLPRMIARHSETDIPKTDRGLKETERDVTRNLAQSRIDEASRTTAISGPMPDNREIQAMKITNVRIKRTGIGIMIGIERGDENIGLKEDLRTTGERLMPMLMAVMHHGVLDPQEGVMSPLGIERKVVTKTVALKILKMESPEIGGTKKEEVLAVQSVTGTEVGK